jgi:hypothetical protein
VGVTVTRDGKREGERRGKGERRDENGKTREREGMRGDSP